MKRQYLGDAKDAFKWDYLDFLTRDLGIQLLSILLMLTPDDNTKQGKSAPRMFPAPRVWDFCEGLRKKRRFDLLCDLPNRVSAAGQNGLQYEVRLCNGETRFVNSDAKRGGYFSGIAADTAQVVFADPDVGFEPPSGGSGKHIRFSEVDKILGEIPQESIVVVFQHSWHNKFPSFREHYNEVIRPWLPLSNSRSGAGVFWCDKALLVVLGGAARIKEVREINRAYQKLPRPVQTLDL